MAEAPPQTSATVGILSEVLSIAAAAFAIQVVREIDRRQEERARNMAQAFPAPPPPPVFENRESSHVPPEKTTAAVTPATPTASSNLNTPNDTAGLEGSNETPTFGTS